MSYICDLCEKPQRSALNIDGEEVPARPTRLVTEWRTTEQGRQIVREANACPPCAAKTQLKLVHSRGEGGVPNE